MWLHSANKAENGKVFHKRPMQFYGSKTTPTGLLKGTLFQYENVSVLSFSNRKVGTETNDTEKTASLFHTTHASTDRQNVLLFPFEWKPKTYIQRRRESLLRRKKLQNHEAVLDK